MHEMCSDRVDVKDFRNYLWLFTIKAESTTFGTTKYDGRAEFVFISAAHGIIC